MASFGEELRRERELRDISLKEISEATKISIRFLEGLEQNNFDILPGGIFNRGFIRAYSRFIGVDGEEMVNAYLHEVSLHEARQAAAARPGRGVQAPATPAASSQKGGSTAAAAPVLQSGVYRPESRSEPRAGTGSQQQGQAGESRRKPPVEFRVTPDAGDSIEGRASLALWVLVVVAVIIGLSVIALSMFGNRPADAAAGDPHAQAVKARLNRKGAAGARTTSPDGTTGQNAEGSPVETPPDAAAIVPPDASPSQPLPADGNAAAAPAPVDQHAAMPDFPSAPVEAAPPPVLEHHLKVQATEATRVRIECAGLVVVDQELWPGQAKSVSCKEPVVISATNAGALQYSLDSAPALLLGALGQNIEGFTLAPLTTAKDPNARP